MFDMQLKCDAGKRVLREKKSWKNANQASLVLFRLQECALVAGVSRLLARGCGTVYQLSCIGQMSR